MQPSPPLPQHSEIYLSRSQAHKWHNPSVRSKLFFGFGSDSKMHAGAALHRGDDIQLLRSRYDPGFGLRWAKMFR